MAEEIILKIVTSETKSHVTLTLTSDLESDIVVNDSSTLTNTTIWFVVALSLIVDVRAFLLGLLGYLRGDDLKRQVM